MLSVRAALEIVLGQVTSLGFERVALTEAAGRILAKPVVATRTVPPFDHSAMDGFAVRSCDVAAASREKPIQLRILETVPAGALPSQPLVEGTTLQVMTGSPLPAGADAVIRIEDVTVQGEWVLICRPARAQDHIRRAGEDFRAGEEVLSPGRLLRPADIGILASMGMTTVAVARRARVGIINTGNELVEPGEPLTPGKITNSNGYTLAAAVREAGGEPLLHGIVLDDVTHASVVFKMALDASDVLLSTGGVSMGSFDRVREVLAGLGVREHFWKVRQKPGKPLSFGTLGHKLIFGLPGNPVSALVCFYLYVRPALLLGAGAKAIHLPVTQTRAACPFSASPGLTDFVRCILRRTDGELWAEPTANQSSGVMRSLSIGDGLAVIPEERDQVEFGDEVRVIQLDREGSQEAPI